MLGMRLQSGAAEWLNQCARMQSSSLSTTDYLLLRVNGRLRAETPFSCNSIKHNQAYSDYKHSLTFCIWHYVVTATKPVHRFQIRPIVHN